MEILCSSNLYQIQNVMRSKNRSYLCISPALLTQQTLRAGDKGNQNLVGFGKVRVFHNSFGIYSNIQA